MTTETQEDTSHTRERFAAIEARLAALDKVPARVDAVAAEVASTRPIADLVKYLLLFWAGLSAVLGFVGWSKFSDLDTLVAQRVQLEFPKDQQKFKDYERLLGETKVLAADFEELTVQYKTAVDSLKYEELVSEDHDVVGRLLILMHESEVRAERDPSDAAGKGYEGTILEPKWRSEAIAVLRVFHRSLKEKRYDSTLVFNVSQICGRLKQFELEQELTKAAFEQNPSPPNEAIALSARVGGATGPDREAAFRRLMAMVRTVGQDSPEIVLAEAWNAAEETRRYSELIRALEDLITERSTVHKGKTPGLLPSYVFVIKATALLRRSAGGDLASAEEALKTAARVVRSESPRASWYTSTLRELAQLRGVVQKANLLDQVIDDSGQSTQP